jgi:hypothetical protein
VDAEGDGPKPKKKKKKPKASTSPPPDVVAEPVSAQGQQTQTPVARWFILGCSLILAGIRLARCAARESASSSASVPEITLREPAHPADEASSFQCGVDCKKDCLRTTDPVMQSACMSLCDDRCSVAGDGDPDSCRSKCESACSSASSPNAQASCAAQCSANCDNHPQAPADAKFDTGVAECDDYLNTWSKCQPNDRKGVKDMAERLAGLIQMSSDHTEVIALCTKSGKLMKSACGMPEPAVSASASASPSASTGPKAAPPAASSAKSR